MWFKLKRKIHNILMILKWGFAAGEKIENLLEINIWWIIVFCQSELTVFKKEFPGTKPYLHSDKQTCPKLSCMQQKVCDDILFSKTFLKECAFKDDDWRSLPVVPDHFKYFKTPNLCNDSLLSYLPNMQEKFWEKPSTKINNPVLKAIWVW